MEAPKLSRRRPDQVRALLLDAAAVEFSRNGMYGARTSDIVERAGVSTSAMYRHFADKSELFRAAMLAPLVGFLDEFAETWRGQLDEPWDDYRLMRSFVQSLYEAMSQHRGSLLALVSAADHADLDVVTEVRDSVATVFSEIVSIGSQESVRREWFSAEGLDEAIRVIVGMVLGLVAFEPVLLAGIDDDRPIGAMLDQCAALVIWGLRRAPAD